VPLPKFPVSKVAENGNFERALDAVSRYNRRRDEAETEYKHKRKVAESELEEELWAIIGWQPPEAHPLITEHSYTEASTDTEADPRRQPQPLIRQP
jgi:hypothetical protein